jgi:hypothetical protein
VSSSAHHFCNINAINTNHSSASTGILIIRDVGGQCDEEMARLTIPRTTIVRNMTRQKENVLMETSKLSQRICLSGVFDEFECVGAPIGV